MFKAMDSFSNFVRSLALLGLLGVVCLGGWFGYDQYYRRDAAIREAQEKVANLTRDLQARAEKIREQREQIQRQSEEIERQGREIERLDTALRLSKTDHRVAHLDVVDQWTGDEGQLMTRLRFVEVDGEGRPLEEPRQFVIEGNMVHINAWVAKFEDDYVERGVPLRNTSICLFKTLHGEKQAPSDGYPLDPVGSRPRAYSRGSRPSELEEQIWKNFWEFANDPKKAAEVGLRAAHGEGPFTQVRKGKLYKIQLRASDGLTIVPLDAPAPQRDPL